MPAEGAGDGWPCDGGSHVVLALACITLLGVVTCHNNPSRHCSLCVAHTIWLRRCLSLHRCTAHRLHRGEPHRCLLGPWTPPSSCDTLLSIERTSLGTTVEPIEQILLILTGRR